MKTSPNDVSNQEILQEFKKVSENMDKRMGTLEVSNQEILKEFKKLSTSNTETKEELKKLSAETKEELKELSADTKELKKLSLETKDGLHNLSVKVDTNHTEVLETVQSLAEHMDEEFSKVRDEMATKGELYREVGKIRAVMVTKDYLDEKLASQYSDIIQHTRREIERAMR